MKLRRNIFVFALLPLWVLTLTIGLFINKTTLSAAPDTLTVTNTNDSGAGSLRQAMLDANDNDTDMDTIEFNIPGSGPHIIKPQTNLPPVSEKITINGFSQPGSQPNTAVSPNPINSVIKIEIDGSDLGSTTGFLIGGTASESVIKGLSIHSFKGPQIQINAVSDVKITGNFIGLKNDGQTVGSGQGNYLKPSET